MLDEIERDIKTALLRLRRMRTTRGFPHRAGCGMNPQLGLLFSLDQGGF